ncbi:single-stranded DNA-binding protein [Bacillus sp. AFS040349]|uniref:single-stranded DNA-binding protein n=1 Tax=Bacillus sp. AFS040349 TaxID=2033502 RepID=UPI000BFE2AAB|nr:single-stranded DNA-binding protein [Bacillus sp. AFS040349]PGT83257.1 single-stranded DNA-binding protein [Bacillus sp. AFS040349]
MSINRIVLVGRLTKNPELKFTPSGVAVATFTLAVNRTFPNQQGEYEADFLNCVVWRKQAESAADHLKKGNLCGVDGRLQSRTYQDQSGKTVFVTEVVAESVQFLEPKGNRNSGQGNNSNNNNQGNNNYGGYQGSGNNNNSGGYESDPFANMGTPVDIPDDNLPF